MFIEILREIIEKGEGSNIKYNWRMYKNPKSDEVAADLHLFSISIIKDILLKVSILL